MTILTLRFRMAYNTEYNDGKKNFLSSQKDDEDDSQNKIVRLITIFLFERINKFC